MANFSSPESVSANWQPIRNGYLLATPANSTFRFDILPPFQSAIEMNGTRNIFIRFTPVDPNGISAF